MADTDDIRRIAAMLPQTTVSDDGLGMSVVNNGKEKGIVWMWTERVGAKRPRVPHPDVVAVRVPHNADKEMLIAASPEIYFTEPHYNGFPAVLVRLSAIEPDELEELLIDGWRTLAPKALVKQFDATQGPA